jgi:DNA modification methylase
LFEVQMIQILQGDCREVLKTLPDCSVHCCVTSPPYFGLRDYGCAGQIGLESTPDAYVAELVAVFREVKRVLRDDGTLWLNLGDSYSGSGKGPAGNLGKIHNEREIKQTSGIVPDGLKPKDLIGIPWRVAFALQADGWYLRQDIIWAKPNPMPESVRDRCTKAHEYIFLLAKSERYYYDAEAIAEPVAVSTVERLSQPTLAQQEGSWRVPGKTNGAMKAVGPRFGGQKYGDSDDPKHATKSGNVYPIPGPDARRNKRSVWTVTTKPYREAHFATFPPDLIQPCIRAGCPAQCCSKCGAPLERVVEKTPATSKKCPKTDALYQAQGGKGEKKSGTIGMSGGGRINGTSITIGFYPTCTCNNDDDEIDEEMVCPGTVLDPFGGSGTTGEVAASEGRKAILIELNPEYVKLAKNRGGLFYTSNPNFQAGGTL